MDGYTLSRQWYDFAFENPDKITICQGALYMWLIEVNNRGGWAEKFPFNTEDACKATGVNNRKTIWKALNELAELGFVVIVLKSSHRHKPSVVSLPIVAHDLNGSLDKAINYQSKERTSKETVSGPVGEQYADQLGTSKETVSGHSNKPLNNKPNNTPSTPAGAVAPNRHDAFLKEFNKITGRSFKTLDSKTKTQFDKLKKAGYQYSDFVTAITNGLEDSRTWQKPQLYTPEYITREANFSKYLNWKAIGTQSEYREPRAFNSIQEHYEYWGGSPAPKPEPSAA